MMTPTIRLPVRLLILNIKYTVHKLYHADVINIVICVKHTVYINGSKMFGGKVFSFPYNNVCAVST
jgi:hypothetical protein